MNLILVLTILIFIPIGYTGERRIQYLSVERPRLEYNRQYLSFVNLTSRRFGRQNPIYYVDVHFNVLIYFGNNISFHFYIYQDMSNGHKRLMMEFPYRFCDFLKKDSFFGAPMRQGKLLGRCPFKPGDYHLYNMSISNDAIPQNFPHFKGMIAVNVTNFGTGEFIVRASIEMDVKTIRIKD